MSRSRLTDPNRIENAWGATLGKRAARQPSGLYGYPKSIQSSCEASVRKLRKAALKIVKSAYQKDAKVAQFLETHAKRNKSMPARVLLATLNEARPVFGKFAIEGGKTAAGGRYGLYGYNARTASLGVQACAAFREAAGHIASDLHRRKAAKYGRITGFLKDHWKQGKNGYARMLHASYPDESMRLASDKKAALPMVNQAEAEAAEFAEEVAKIIARKMGGKTDRQMGGRVLGRAKVGDRKYISIATGTKGMWPDDPSIRIDARFHGYDPVPGHGFNRYESPFWGQYVDVTNVSPLELAMDAGQVASMIMGKARSKMAAPTTVAGWLADEPKTAGAYLTVVPAYGRDYASKAKVLEDWNDGKDFKINDMSSPYDGKYINKQDADGDGSLRAINIRYNKLRKVVVINL